MVRGKLSGREIERNSRGRNSREGRENEEGVIMMGESKGRLCSGVKGFVTGGGEQSKGK